MRPPNGFRVALMTGIWARLAVWSKANFLFRQLASDDGEKPSLKLVDFSLYHGVSGGETSVVSSVGVETGEWLAERRMGHSSASGCKQLDPSLGGTLTWP